MEESGGGGVRDDRSTDSGVSSLGSSVRSGSVAGNTSCSNAGISGNGNGSGDERSGSRSSALSSLGDDSIPAVVPNVAVSSSVTVVERQQQQQQQQHHQIHNSSQSNVGPSVPNHGQQQPIKLSATTAQSLSHHHHHLVPEVWREAGERDSGGRLLQSNHHHHHHHQNHPNILAPPPLYPPPPPTPSSGSNHSVSGQNSMTELWSTKQRYTSASTSHTSSTQSLTTSLHSHQQHHSSDTRERIDRERLERERLDRERLERERHERIIRERREQEVRDHHHHQQVAVAAAAQQQLQRDKERDKVAAERERQERERLEKHREAEQAVHKHFEESLRLAQQKIHNQLRDESYRATNRQNGRIHHQHWTQDAASAKNNWPHQPSQYEQQQRNMGWINSLPNPQQGRNENSKLGLPPDSRLIAQNDRLRIHENSRAPSYYSGQAHISISQAAGQQQHSSSRSIPNKVEYPPPPAHSRKIVNEKPHTALPKAEPNFTLFGSYPGYQPAGVGFVPHESKIKDIKSNTLVNSKQAEVLTSAQPISDLKNSVIVKNDKSPNLHHSPSPKLREYLPPSAKSPYEYRSPSQSPHVLEVQNLASISKVGHVHRPTPQNAPVGQHLNIGSSASAQRASPHHRASPLPPHRQSPHATHITPLVHPSSSPSPGVSVYSKPSSTVPYASYYAPPSTPPKPKVSSPAPIMGASIYVKPRPLSRNDQPLKGTLTPSPYQQVSHSLPPPSFQARSSATTPPPAHGSTKSLLKHVKRPPSPPRIPGLTVTSSFQTQPLDLGITSCIKKESPKRKSEDEPIELDLKKIKVEENIKTEDENSIDLSNRINPVLSSISTCTTTTVVTINASPAVVENVTPIKIEPAHSPGLNPSKTVHKLKKAWLQRHSGEDVKDSTDVQGSGMCETLPMPFTNLATNKCSPMLDNERSLPHVGSMAVNSIKKPKGNRKGVKEMNGHINLKVPDGDDSSSSDPERRSTPVKRVPPKVKRKKGGRKQPFDEIKRKKTSISSTDSDKESGSEKDSDSTTTSTGTVGGRRKEDKSSGNGPVTGKKRGRRPKNLSTPSKNGNDEESRNSNSIKKQRGSDDRNSTPSPSSTFNNSNSGRDSAGKNTTTNRINYLKKTGEAFLQDGACFEVAPKLPKCRECRWTQSQRSKNGPNIFCRFFAFRRLRYNKNGIIAMAGFSEARHAQQDDLKLWLPLRDSSPPGLDLDMSKFLLAQIGDQFCALVQQEKEALSIHMSEDKQIAWKRVVQGVREMCDVCETTLFNFHWACGKCGFVVCIDCYKSRKNGTVTDPNSGKDRDEVGWLLCTNRQQHEQEKLMLTQIIAGDALNSLEYKVHEVRRQWKISQNCSCKLMNQQSNFYVNGMSKDLTKKNRELNGVSDVKDKTDDKNSISFFANSVLDDDDTKKEHDSLNITSEGQDDSYSTLRVLLTQKSGTSPSSSPSPLDNFDRATPSPVVEETVPYKFINSELKNFIRRRLLGYKERIPMSEATIITALSNPIYKDIPHQWICEGRMMRFIEPNHSDNFKVFQDQWKRGQPVMISNLSKLLSKELWTPESFIKDFGDTRTDLVNCLTGATVSNQSMKRFWEGFDTYNRRLKDDKSQPMLLKLKDWPPGEDFAEMLPSRFNELTKVLPMGEYTSRSGRLNLASRLPECFVKPDLGPKMYTAYGSVLNPSKGTTNLHLDISDAVNVMMHVSVLTDTDNELYLREILKVATEAGVDETSKERLRTQPNDIPGALWDIFAPKDADKIRDLLNKVAQERGEILEPHHDPIHDQDWYIDTVLRKRLKDEYNVHPYTIIQCVGDAIFIPAGAPHQVRNLNNCIKVAEDFVSPENVSHCFNLTQEFRNLSDTHTNHEDKLQIKNIMYHAVKDSLSMLSTAFEEKPNSATNNNNNNNNNNNSADVNSALPTSVNNNATTITNLIISNNNADQAVKNNFSIKLPNNLILSAVDENNRKEENV